MSTQTDLKWRGYAVHDTKKWHDFKVIDFEPKRFEDYDIDVRIEYCGVCGSDVHTITGGWGKPMLPVIPGHEIVGTVVRVGPKVTEFKPGDRAGVGPQVGSCFQCTPCKTDNEQYCPDLVDTYNASYPNGDTAYGGYATAIRAHERYVFPIPAGLASEEAAPMLCAGLTVYSPLVRNGAGPGKKVGIAGLGGLGHFAVQFAHALGAEVTVFSHSPNKKDDALAMGATRFVATGEEDFAKPLAGTLDLIICTMDDAQEAPLAQILTALRVNGRCIVVAKPDGDAFPKLTTSDLSANGALVGATHIGSKKEAVAMLQLAAEKGVKSWIEVLPMSKVGEAVQRINDNSVRYRHVLKVDI